MKILFIADTHLGFDYPFRATVNRRRRGDDFFANYEAVLQPAMKGEVDAVLHGGDLLFRSKVAPKLVWMAFQPLINIAERGIPVYIVPGNHERSAIPYELLGSHPHIHVFHDPMTFVQEVKGLRIAWSGFPCDRDDVRNNFPSLLDKTGYQSVNADFRFLCIHQAVEGATVGTHDFTFRHTPDVIRGKDIPPGFTAVLSGHIHRHQILQHDLLKNKLTCPVVYPGSIERTSFAEMNEHKGYYIITLDNTSHHSISYDFNDLYARPMIRRMIPDNLLSEQQIQSHLEHLAICLPMDAILQLSLPPNLQDISMNCLRAEALRAIFPWTMNVELSYRRTNEKEVQILPSYCLP